MSFHLSPQLLASSVVSSFQIFGYAFIEPPITETSITFSTNVQFKWCSIKAGTFTILKNLTRRAHVFVCEKVINLHDKCAMQIKGKNEKMKLPTRTVMCTDMMLINAPLILWKAIIMAWACCW